MLFPFGVRPFPDVCPSVRVSLQALTFRRGQSSDDPAHDTFRHKAFPTVSDISRFRFQCCTAVAFLVCRESLLAIGFSFSNLRPRCRPGILATQGCRLASGNSSVVQIDRNSRIVCDAALMIPGNGRNCLTVAISTSVKDDWLEKGLVLKRRERSRLFCLHQCAFPASCTSRTDFQGVGCLPCHHSIMSSRAVLSKSGNALPRRDALVRIP